MPYEKEFAGYQPLRRIVETDRVRNLLRRCRVNPASTNVNGGGATPRVAPPVQQDMPDFVVAIDGSNAEVPVVNGYPGARVGYCTVASVLVNLTELDRLDEQRPIDPVAFRKTEEAATIDAALPGCNVVTRDHVAAKHSFREALFDTFNDVILDEEDRSPLSDTYEALLALKPETRNQSCPYEAEGCGEHVRTSRGLSRCPCDKGRPLYSTDALRIHERFRDWGSNGEAYGEVMQVWERVLLVHLLRCLERRGWLYRLPKLAFFVDGPLAVFGHPAWLSAAISTELKRLNALVQEQSGHDMLIVGIEKSGTFVAHFDEVDMTEEPGTELFPPRSFFMPSDQYIKSRIIFSSSPKRYGVDTYFGRKVFYKTASGARVVVNIPFLSDEQDTLANDPTLYPQLGMTLALLDKLVSSRYPNALAPIVSAHAQAAIPLHLGAKVLQQLARALVQEAPR
jgi:NurA domain